MTEHCWALEQGATYEKGFSCSDRTEHCHCLDERGSWGRHRVDCPLPEGCTCGTRRDPNCKVHSQPVQEKQ